jgi:hypothetical protein
MPVCRKPNQGQGDVGQKPHCQAGLAGDSCGEQNNCVSGICQNYHCEAGGNGAYCTHAKDCVQGPGQKQPVCIDNFCTDGQVGARCRIAADCVTPPNLTQPVCLTAPHAKGDADESYCQSGEKGAACVQDSDCISGQCSSVTNAAGISGWFAHRSTCNLYDYVYDNQIPEIMTYQYDDVKVPGLPWLEEYNPFSYFFGEIVNCPKNAAITAFCASGMDRDCHYGLMSESVIKANNATKAAQFKKNELNFNNLIMNKYGLKDEEGLKKAEDEAGVNPTGFSIHVSGWLSCGVEFEGDYSDVVQVYRTNATQFAYCPLGYVMTGMCFSGSGPTCYNDEEKKYVDSVINCTRVTKGTVAETAVTLGCPHSKKNDDSFVVNNPYSVVTDELNGKYRSAFGGTQDKGPIYALTGYCNSGAAASCECGTDSDGNPILYHSAGVFMPFTSEETPPRPPYPPLPPLPPMILPPFPPMPPFKMYVPKK